MNNYIIPNLAKACDVLALVVGVKEGYSASEIEEKLSITRTTAFRILKTLCSKRLLAKQGARYIAGAGILELGLRALNTYTLREQAVPVLHKLTELTGQTSHLAVLNGEHSLILEVCDSSNPVRVASRPGTLADLHCSSTGKIFLAYIFKDRLDDLYSGQTMENRTENTLTDIASLSGELANIRRQGYAVDNQEYHMAIRCLAAPVRNLRNDVVAAIGITATANDFTIDITDQIAGMVMGSAKELSKLLV